MGDLLPATASALQLILGRLWGALLGISGSMRHVPALPAFFWETLVGAVVLVLILKRRHALRSVKALGKTCSAHEDVCGKGTENAGPTTGARDTHRPPGMEASALSLQILCLMAINTDPSSWSLQAAVHLLEELEKSQPPKPSQGTDERPTFTGSEKDAEQLQKKTMGDFNENTHFPARVELLEQGITTWKQRVREKEEEKERLAKSNAQRKQVLKDQLSRRQAVAESLRQSIFSRDLLGDRVDGGNSDAEQKREAEPGHPSIGASAVGAKGTTDGADFNAPLQSLEEQRRETARQLREQDRMNAELVERVRSLQTEQASWLQENAKLESEIQQLKLKLQILPQVHEDRLRQLQKRVLEERTRSLEIEKQLPGAYANMTSACQILSLYKQMAEDLGREVERTTTYTRKEIVFHARRAQQSWMAAVLTTRELDGLRRENDRTRQMLATAESACQPFPRGPGAPATPAALRGPEVWEDGFLV
uniref:Uncharacterized protein n=1 Tax=Equus caballus TaxID=9796 RepID=A0A3Q2GZ73_HORSE